MTRGTRWARSLAPAGLFLMANRPTRRGRCCLIRSKGRRDVDAHLDSRRQGERRRINDVDHRFASPLEVVSMAGLSGRALVRQMMRRTLITSSRSVPLDEVSARGLPRRHSRSRAVRRQELANLRSCGRVLKPCRVVHPADQGGMLLGGFSGRDRCGGSPASTSRQCTRASVLWAGVGSRFTT